MGGVGKSQIALEYGYRQCEKGTSVFWINCETSLAISESFRNIANHFHLPGASPHNIEVERVAFSWLLQLGELQELDAADSKKTGLQTQ